LPGVDAEQVEEPELEGCGLRDDRRVVACSGDDLHGGECAEDEPAGGDGGPPGVQAGHRGLALFGEAAPDLAFYQAEDEQGQADDGDQGGDAPVVLAEQGGDGEGAFERGVAAFYCFLAFAGDQDPGGGGFAGGQVGEQGVPAVGGGLGIDRLLVEYPGEGGLAGAGIGAGLCLQVGADPPAGSDDREAGTDLAFGRVVA
jgi:hypothetical protein